MKRLKVMPNNSMPVSFRIAALVLLSISSFIASLPPAVAATCDAVFSNGVQSHASGGTINLSHGSEIRGGETTLSTVSLTADANVTCGAGTCSSSGYPSASSSPEFVFGNASEGNVASNGNINLEQGDYGTVTINQDRRLRFRDSEGLYMMRGLFSNFQSEIEFSSGDYWIDGDLHIGQETELINFDGGTVRVFVNGNVNLDFRAETSGFAPNQLLIYATGDITTENDVEASAFFYAEGEVNTSFGTEVQGALAGVNVDVSNETLVVYPGSSLADAEFLPFCGEGISPAARLISHWRMDEAIWNGTSGEVRDVSGNNNHGTVQGGASTESTSPARAGDPGTCGYGTFDGNDGRVAVPELSDTLNSSASLAFWMRTNQSGSDDVWLAPAVTGVEEEGGEDDIFWGWIDSGGHVGLGVGNTGGVQSSQPVNDGNWVHVVLTRNHESGEHQVFINGQLNNSATNRTGAIGNGYSNIGRVENINPSNNPVYFEGDLDEVRVYSGVLSESDVAEIYNAVHPCSSAICPQGSASPGLWGGYYENQALSGEPSASRADGVINFSWEEGEGPAELGGRGEDFSIRWEGRLNVTDTSQYYFRTLSDDGVRLWVDNELIIDNWTDHAVTEDISSPVRLEAGSAYDIRLEYYENAGRAEISLHWRQGPQGNFTLIPSGNSSETAPGLYHCPETGVVSYTLEHSSAGVTCEAEPVLITARDAEGNPVAPTAGTEMILGASPATPETAWVEGDRYMFSGSEVSVLKYLSQTSPAALELSVTDGSATGASGPIEFAGTGLRFYGNRALDPLPDQGAGETDPEPVVRAVRTDDETGSCLARVANETRPVELGYECINPAVCQAGQSLTLSAEAVEANHSGEPPAFTPVALAFDSDGFADIPLNYSDVGTLRLWGRLDLPAEDEQPAGELVGGSPPFVVKPYTLAVVSVVDANGTDNPGTTAGGAGFAAAGETFSVTLESRNALGNPTPNFGQESPAQTARVELAGLSYPSGGSLGNLGSPESFTPESGGRSANAFLTWDNVGTITLAPRLQGNDYQGAGDLAQVTESDDIGRFYPFDFALASSSVSDACGSFSYLHHADINVNFTVAARNVFGGTVTNYDNTDQATFYSSVATPEYVAENDGAGNGAVLSPRIQLASFTWEDGILRGEDDSAAFLRALSTGPDGPWPELQWGLQLNDSLDNRSLVGLDMNAFSAGDCTALDNCSAAMLGEPLNLRFGRLRLNDAYGPEVVDLPVRFYTEYWDGQNFVRNTDDSCTRIPREAIRYPDGHLVNDSNRTVALGDGSTTGEYANLDGVGVNFQNSDAEHFFTAPEQGNTGRFEVQVDLGNRPWLRYDWSQDGDHLNDVLMPAARFGFGSYRGHDRIIYWREVLE